MQAVKSINSAMMKYDRKQKSRGKWIVYATNFQAGRDNWISEAIVAQAIHEANCFTFIIEFPAQKLHKINSWVTSITWQFSYLYNTNGITVIRITQLSAYYLPTAIFVSFNL